MKQMLRALLANVVAMIALDAPAALPDLDGFDAHFRRVLDEAGVPGGAYAIVAPDRILRIDGHGRRQLHGTEAIDGDTVFRLASVSKTFAGPIALLLQQEGRLELGSPLADALPSLRFKREALSRQLRLEDLLGQSTGLVPNAYDNLIDDGLPLARILPRFRELEPICAPRSCYSYQNIAFSLIEPAIAQATGDDYAHLVEQRLFKPLGMDRASFGLEALRAEANHARPHRRAGTGWVEAELSPNYYQLAPAAGANASARDLARWLQAQMGTHPEVLPDSVVEAVTAPRVRTPRELRRRLWGPLLSDAHYGLGWRHYRIGEDALHYHSGWVRGYVTEIAWSPRHRIGLVLLLNAESPAIGRISTRFWAELHGLPESVAAP